jgi:hypothetical protein
MKTLSKILLLSVFAFICFSCHKDATDTAPQIPSLETMVIDFGELGDIQKSTEKSAVLNGDKTNWIVSAATLGIWKLIIGTTFAIPVTAFAESFENLPEQIADNTWQWEYSVDGLGGTYKARLVGTNLNNSYKWEMYISKEGSQGFGEFMWFEGTSAKDESNGKWTLYHSPEYNEPLLTIDWEKQNEEIGQITYSYVRELNDERNPDPMDGSYLIYGLQDVELDAYLEVYAWNQLEKVFTQTFIEWNTTNYSGKIKAEHFYNDALWHCWNAEGENVDCN